MDKLLLYTLGLNDKEIEIYLFLNENGVQTVKQISDKTGINRTTTYRYLESLREKGLITWLIED
jgi:sugar-specific transcriptional regulator TrmB